MGLLSSRMSITRYQVTGQLDGSVHETVYQGLKQHAIPKIEDDGAEASVGWTSFETPYAPDFEGYSFVFGTDMVFALRIDKKSIKDQVVNTLIHRIPATPNVYDLVWNYDAASLWFFSNLKAANEALETLFVKSFNLQLIRLFPYTTADRRAKLSDQERDVLRKLEKSRSE